MTSRGFSLTLGFLMLTSASPAFAAYQQNMFPSLRVTTETQSGTVTPLQASGAATQNADEDAVIAGEASYENVMTGIAPTQILTREEFTALVVEKMYTQIELDTCFWDIASSVPPAFTLVFTDVHVNDRFAKHICIAMRDGIVDGYADGSFRGERQINFAESAKILSRAYALAPYAHLERGAPWYRAHVQALAAQKAIPLSVNRMDHLMTAAQSTEMLARIAGGITSLPSRTYEELMPKPRTKPAAASTPKPSVAKPVTGSASSKAATTSSTSSAIKAISSAASSSSKKTLWNPF